MKTLKALFTLSVVRFIVISIGLMTIIVIAYFYLVKYIYLALSNRGLFGDSFVLLNAVFSGLAFAGLIYTILEQQKQLEQQKKDSEEQKKLLQKHHDEQKNQARNIFDEQKHQIQTNFDNEKMLLRKQI